ncbi:MAG: hypothetical protein J0H82_26540 [Alphaproteobacteria bacterium]|jgi:hypothetical protein|nr:hypothetical protein [Alphaproteobacteria bacterium]
MTWSPMAVLANVELRAGIGNDVAALVPAADPRVVALKRQHRNFRRFLQRFSDNFGERFEPAVLLLDDGAPAAFRSVGAVASFRDLIAISAVIHGRARALHRGTRHGIVFGESLALYPWMIDRHYEGLVSITPAQRSAADVDAFRGQSSPQLNRADLDDADLDEPLLEMLMARWSRHYRSANREWSDLALFRSLNMAYQASLMPAGVDTIVHDLGRTLALWVAAFEILTHPGRSRSGSARDRVFALIERTPWLLENSAARDYQTGDRKNPAQRTLSSWLYQLLNNHRNDFLHGEPIEPDGLILPEPRRPILDYAAPLYRIALTGFLPLQRPGPVPPLDDAEAFGAAVARHRVEEAHQRIVEEALLTAVRPARARPTRSRRIRHAS